MASSGGSTVDQPAAAADAPAAAAAAAAAAAEPFDASRALNETPRTKAGAITLYDAWAPSYDHTLVSWGYEGPACTAALLGRFAQPGSLQDEPLLDCGCGTGLVAEALEAAGITGPRTGTGPSTLTQAQLRLL